MPHVENFLAAPEVAKIARALIKEHHPHLRPERILYLFTGKTPTKGGKVVYGKAGLITELEAALFGDGSDGIEADFYMVITRSEWILASEEARVAMVDHELCHMYYDLDTDKPKLSEHDLQEFNEVIRRHGLWSADTQKTARVIQPYLPGLGEEDAKLVPDNVDPDTGEITEGPSVTITMGDKSATIRGGAKALQDATEAPGKDRGKPAQKPRSGKTDGFGNPLKRGSMPTGPQVPVTT